MKPLKASDVENGIPKKSAKVNKEIAADYYKLGRVSAALEQKKKDVDSQAQMNLIQQMQLQELMLKIKEMKLDLESQQKLALMSGLQVGGGGAGSPYPPIPPDVGMPMGMPPPLPEQPPNVPPPLPVEGNYADAGGLPPMMAPAPPMM